MTRINLTATASDACRVRNPELFGAPAPQAVTLTDAPSIGRSTHKTMNKTESRYYDTLIRDCEYDPKCIFVQPTRFFKLTGGGTYTPDFLVVDQEYNLNRVVEIKGGYRGPGWEQGYERWKRAAMEYSGHGNFVFYLITWDRHSGEWREQQWNPLKYE